MTRTTSSTSTTRTTRVRLLTIGVAATGLCAVGTGLAFAAGGGATLASPTRAVEDVARDRVDAAAAGTEVATDSSALPEGYTQEQYEAFWGAGFVPEDVTALEDLWSLDTTEVKARAGQLVLDGAALPFEPGTHATAPLGADETAAVDAFFAAGYQWPEVEELAALWQTDTLETKTRAGQALLDGQTLPVAPSGADLG